MGGGWVFYAGAAVARGNQRGNPCVQTVLARNQLIDRDRVVEIEANIGSREPDVARVVTNKLPTGRMGKLTEDREILLMSGKRLKRAGEFVVGTVGPREPVPIAGWIAGFRQGDTIAEKERTETLRFVRGGRGGGSHRF